MSIYKPTPNFSFGNSGSILTVYNSSIRKKFPMQESRLKHQLQKQINFKDFSVFKTPKVLDVGYQNNEFYFDMEYIDGLSSIEFLSYADKKSMDKFVNSIIDLIEHEIENCKFQIINKDIITNKINSIDCDKTTKKQILNYFTSFSTENDIILPIGFCHGDLTLTNMIFTHEHIYLIDFLDVFLESPIQDIVKLRQDTKFYWSLLKDTSDRKDLVKLKINCMYIDQKFDKHFQKYFWYTKYYKLFQILNLLRIIPYSKSNNFINNKIIFSIKEMLGE